MSYRRPDRPVDEPRSRGPKVRVPDVDPASERDPHDLARLARVSAKEIALERRERIARRTRLARGIGLALVALGALLAWLTVSDLRAGIRVHPDFVVRTSAMTILSGAWLAVVGVGGVDSDHVTGLPRWVRNGIVVALVAGLLSRTVWLEVLRVIAGG